MTTSKEQDVVIVFIEDYRKESKMNTIQVGEWRNSSNKEHWTLKYEPRKTHHPMCTAIDKLIYN